MTKWQDLFDNKVARVIEGVGFTVRLYSQGGLRYSERERTLTLLTELVDESNRLGRKWLIFPNVVVLVYLPSSLEWDDGTPVDPIESRTVVNRIQNAINAARESCRVEVSDQVYQQARRDWEEFGPTRNQEEST